MGQRWKCGKRLRLQWREFANQGRADWPVVLPSGDLPSPKLFPFPDDGARNNAEFRGPDNFNCNPFGALYWFPESPAIGSVGTCGFNIVQYVGGYGLLFRPILPAYTSVPANAGRAWFGELCAGQFQPGDAEYDPRRGNWFHYWWEGFYRGNTPGDEFLWGPRQRVRHWGSAKDPRTSPLTPTYYQPSDPVPFEWPARFQPLELLPVEIPDDVPLFDVEDPPNDYGGPWPLPPLPDWLSLKLYKRQR